MLVPPKTERRGQTFSAGVCRPLRASCVAASCVFATTVASAPAVLESSATTTTHLPVLAADPATPSNKPVTTKTAARNSFDLEILKRRGIDPHLAEYFREAPRFTPGPHQVTLYVNGEKRGVVDATFDAEGQLCFNQTMLNRAGLVLPAKKPPATPTTEETLTEEPLHQPQESSAETASNEGNNSVLNDLSGPISAWANKTSRTASSEARVDQSSCIDFLSTFPQTEVALRPGQEEVRLAVPSDALRPMAQDFTGYSSGGLAGLVNYDFLSTSTQSDGDNTQYRSLNTEIGMNIGDWSVRSRQSMVDFNGERNTENLYAFAEHSLVGLQSVFQVGQINIASPIFPGAAITGMQVLPDAALRPKSTSGVSVSGIAQTSQARVELTQNGIVIYSTVVPSGPFTLRDIPLLQGNTDVVLTVFENDGNQHSDRIAAASLRIVDLVADGFSIAAGQVREVGDSGSDTPPVITLSDGWLVGDHSVLATGLMLTPDYRAVGWNLGTEFTGATSVGLNSIVSQANELGESGMQNSVTLNTRLSNAISLSASATRRSEGYLDLSDTTQNNSNGSFDSFDSSQFGDDDSEVNLGAARTDYSLGLGVSAQQWGAGNLTYTQSSQSGTDTSRSLSASWGTRVGIAWINATLRHGLNEEDSNGMYLSISLPLGRSRSVRAFSSESNGRSQVGATYNETVSDALSYSVSATQADDDDSPGVGGTVSALPRYAQLNLGYNEDSKSSNSNVGISGGLVVHSEGITASPYAVQDTFGVAKVGDIAGIKLSTPSGPVWTDAGGRAIVARLPAFGNGAVEVNTNTLPRNIDLNNGYQAMDTGRGSVNFFDFGVVKVRRALLTVVDANGTLLPKGASVVDAQDRFVTSVVDGGKIFLGDATQKGLIVSLANGTRCALVFELPETVNAEQHFERLSAQCRPLI